VGRAEAVLGGGQAYRAAVAADLWQTVTLGGACTRDQQARMRLAASHAVECALQAVEPLYRAGGTTTIARTNLLGRCWRDVQVVGQNLAVGPEYYEIAGRAFLGLEPGSRLG
jgi:hypothetical protein